MSVSFEALAMAGLDYNECDMSMEEWEQSEMMIPPHLLAQEEEEKEESGDHVEMMIPPHLLAQEEEEKEESGDHADHISLHEIQELFRSSSKTDGQSRGKCSARKDQLPIIISRVKKTNLVKQLSSKKMMMVEIIGSYLTYASLGLGQT